MITTLPTLYKLSKTGKIQVWTIYVEKNTHWVEEGIQGGKLRRSNPTTCIGKNLGRANATTDEEQALLEATAKHNIKQKDDYKLDVKDIKVDKKMQPMLAKKHVEYKHLMFTVPTYVQPKLDGMRSVNSKFKSLTRNGNLIVSVPHIRKVLEKLPHGVVIDGELYNHSDKDNFNEIISILRKSKNITPEDEEKSAEYIKLYLYDVVSSEVYSERFEILQQIIKDLGSPDCIELVPAIQIFNEEDLKNATDFYINNGYEGAMVRLDLCGYENDVRSKSLLKHKYFDDDEFEIIAVEEGKGNRAGTLGKIYLRMPNGTTCESDVNGTTAFRQELLKRKDDLIGKKATVKFFGYTPAGKLRFPKCIAIRDYE